MTRRARDEGAPVVILSVEESPATAPAPGRGAASLIPVGDAAAAGAVTPICDGACGTHDRAGGEESDPSSPSVLDPAPGTSLSPGAGGPVEPCMAPARDALDAAGGSCGSQGSPSSRSGPREGDAGPGVASPGPAQTSPPALKSPGGARGGRAGATTPVAGPAPAEASAPVPGGTGSDRGRGAGADSSSAAGSSSPPGPGGAARVPAAAPPAPGLRGKTWQDAVRAAQGKQARAGRIRRGRYTAKRAGDGYGPGMTRRQPGGTS
jgi:hypothetical protein